MEKEVQHFEVSPTKASSNIRPLSDGDNDITVDSLRDVSAETPKSFRCVRICKSMRSDS